MNVFVTDGDERPALAITRSLGRRGINVFTGHDGPRSLAAASRFAARSLTYPSPYTDPAAFSEFLIDLVRREHIDVVMPVTDVTTHAVASVGAVLARYSATAAPALAQFELVSDKQQLLQRASRCGISIPSTRFVPNGMSIPEIATGLEYPVVIKPARSRIAGASGWTSTSVRYADDESELLQIYRETPHLAAHPSLLQERIVGSGLGLFVICDHGRVLTAFAHRRIREKPPSGGVSVVCESVAVDPVLRADAGRLLEPLGWHGVAMLEYKEDRRTGRRLLMEVNGRFWGSLQLAVDAGVDFPYLAWQLAVGQPLDVPASYATGIRNRWRLGDFDHLLARWRGPGRGRPQGAACRWRALVDFTGIGSPAARDEIFRASDPGPALQEARSYASAIARSVAARLPAARIRRARALP